VADYAHDRAGEQENRQGCQRFKNLIPDGNDARRKGSPCGGFCFYDHSGALFARSDPYSDMVNSCSDRIVGDGVFLMAKRFRPILVLWLLGFVVLLAGCGRELQQRQAFISFLQKEVIPRNSGILIPTKAMRKKFGIYATHYDVIVEYNKAMLEKVSKPLEKAQRDYQNAVKPEASVQERKEAIVKYLEALQLIEAALDKEFAIAEAEIAALLQPDDLKAAYTQTVEKHVRTPAKALKAMIPAIKEMMGKNQALLDYIAANKGKVEIKDGMIQVDKNRDKDRTMHLRLKDMRDEISKMTQAIQEQHSEFTRQSTKK
jgi:hypothetical protein